MMNPRLTRISIMIFLSLCPHLYPENLPTFYFDLGTSRTDIIFDFGEPKIHMSGGHLLYESYTSARTLENLVFLIDEDSKLFGITIDIGLDYSPSIPEKEYEEKVYNYYGNLFNGVYGKPYIINELGVLWKFDDGFVLFQPYRKDTFLRFKFVCAPREYAESMGYGELYD